MNAELQAEVDSLFRQQLASWPLLRKGVDALASGRTRSVGVRGDRILLRHIPHRAASTTAAVDQKSIEGRPCFLCPRNLFPEQRPVRFGEDFALYCNPFPVVGQHLTVVHRDHTPQRLDGQIGTLLQLAAALPSSFVLYNGPRCGASAPDHMHLQAGSRDGLPVADDAARADGPALSTHGARAFVFRGNDRHVLERRVQDALTVLSEVTGKGPEPWVNVVAFLERRAGLTVVVFPREKHRPERFHNGDLLVSPASIDMSGILVTPSERNFEELTGEVIASVYGEVSLNEADFARALSLLEER